MENKDLSSLIGKTIEKIEWVPYVTLNEEGAQVDDGDYVMIHFNDGFKASFVGGYQEDWTGNSTNEYPTYLAVNIFEPEGYNGPGMYEAKPRNSRRIGDEYFYTFEYGGKTTDIQTGIFRFMADSLEHAKTLLDPDEHQYIKRIDFKPYFDGN